MKRLMLLLAIVVISCLSCARTVWVSAQKNADDHWNTQKAKGIPFYLKVQRYQQETAYEKTWYEVNLRVFQLSPDEIKKDGPVLREKETVSFTYVFNESALEELRTLQAQLVKSDVTADDIKGLRAELEEKAAKKPLTTIEDPTTPVSNRVQPITVVDYRKPFYINAPLQWFGSSSLTSKLGSDGTLTEATATVEPKITEAVTSFLPLKELLSSRWIETDEQPMELLRTEAALPIRATLSIEKKGHSYTFSRIHETDPCGEVGEVWDAGEALEAGEVRVVKSITGEYQCPPISFSDKGNYVRTDLGAKPPKKKDSGQTVSVSGTIELPKK